MPVSVCTRPVPQLGECGRPKFTLPNGNISPMCYWHRIYRTTIEAQIRAAHERLRAAREPHRKRVPEHMWPPGERWCAGCQSFCPLWYCPGSRCKACTAEARHATLLKTEYDITPEQYHALFQLQGGKCAICRNRQLDRRLATDHNHKTGAVRGLLCHTCNHDLLGAAHDSVNILRAAVRYLETPPAGGDWIAPEASRV